MVALIQALAVAEYLSFSRAAKSLGVSQSSVSARIKALEDELGILLFERNTRGVRLTEPGRQFVDRISAGVDHLDHAVKSAGMAALGKCGRLRVGVHGLIPHSFLANLIGRYRDAYPAVEIEIAEGTARETIRLLRVEQLDIAFVVGSPDPPDCRSRPIWTEPLVAALPDRHPLAKQEHVTWSELAGETFLFAPAGQDHRSMTISLCGWRAGGQRRQSSVWASNAPRCSPWLGKVLASRCLARRRASCPWRACASCQLPTSPSRSCSQPCGRPSTKALPSETSSISRIR